MSKLYFPKVKNYVVNENLIFITWPDHFQCFDYITGESQFKIDHGFESLRIIDNKLFGQKKNGADILVYDLKGNLIKTFTGSFYLLGIMQDDQMMFVFGENGKKEALGYKIDITTLSIVATFKEHNFIYFVKDSLGFSWGTNFVNCFNIYTGDEHWKYDLGSDTIIIPQTCYLVNETFIVTTGEGKLICLDIKSGKCLWEKKSEFSMFCMHPVNKNLYGFGRWFTLEIIDSKTGEIVFSKEFPQLKQQFNGDFTFNINAIYNDGLYFAQISRDRKFAKINIPGNEVEFVADLDVPKDLILFSPSFPYNNCYFALDEHYNLHVFRPLMK
jgi:outer membrane protein assembly factor BamB